MNYHLKVSLTGVSSPSVWRRVIVPAHLTFEQLHLVIQAVFGWENSHLYAFCENGLGDLITINCPIDEDAFVTADKTNIDQLMINLYNRSSIRSKPAPFYYIYDYGDEWRHLIEVENIDYSNTAKLAVLSGEGATPPEDCGGPHIFNALKTSPEKLPDHLVLPIGFDPAIFDIQAAKANLRTLERYLGL